MDNREELVFDSAISINQNVSISSVTLLSFWDISGTPSSYNVQWPRDRVLPMRSNTTVMVYSKSGRGKVHLKDGTIVDVVGHCALFLDPTQIESYYCCGSDWKLNWMELIVSGGLNVPYCKPISLDEEHLVVDMRQATKHLGSDPLNEKQLGLAMVNTLVYQVACLSTKHTDVALDPRVVDAMTMINSDIYRKWQISEIAEAVGCAPSTLRKLFQQNLGLSPKRYILNTKLDFCFTFFQRGETVISHIAKELNFFDATHFEKEFKRRFGTNARSFIPQKSSRL